MVFCLESNTVCGREFRVFSVSRYCCFTLITASLSPTLEVFCWRFFCRAPSAAFPPRVVFFSLFILTWGCGCLQGATPPTNCLLSCSSQRSHFFWLYVFATTLFFPFSFLFPVLVTLPAGTVLLHKFFLNRLFSYTHDLPRCPFFPPPGPSPSYQLLLDRALSTGTRNFSFADSFAPPPLSDPVVALLHPHSFFFLSSYVTRSDSCLVFYIWSEIAVLPLGPSPRIHCPTGIG